MLTPRMLPLLANTVGCPANVTVGLLPLVNTYTNGMPRPTRAVIGPKLKSTVQSVKALTGTLPAFSPATPMVRSPSNGWLKNVPPLLIAASKPISRPLAVVCIPRGWGNMLKGPPPPPPNVTAPLTMLSAYQFFAAQNLCVDLGPATLLKIWLEGALRPAGSAVV